jgi:general secretion pathway protein M
MKRVGLLYKTLSEKDRRALHILSAFLVPVLLYFLIINPGVSYYLAAKQQYSSNLELLDWINHSAALIQATPGPTNKMSGESLLQIVTTSAEASKISISRLQPEGSDKISLWLNDIEFATLTRWLSKLISQQALTIVSISVDKTNNPGVVNARCIISSTRPTPRTN